MNDLIPPAPPGPANQKKNSLPLRSSVGIFVTSFLLLMVILNAPAIVSALTYPLSHNQDTENQQLTDQYRALYGYDSHQGIAQAATPIPTAVTSENTISIPSIDVNAPIQFVSSTDDNTILAALKNGVVLYPGSAYPGAGGTTVIVGHSSSDLPWTKYSAIFARLDKLQANDLIYINFSRQEYVYQIRAIQTGSVQQIIDSGIAGDLVLSSCWPIGTDQHRIAVTANRIR